MSGFRDTESKGFHITFANGYTVSVQWGPGNYCDNYDKFIGDSIPKRGWESSTAETAVWAHDRKLIDRGDGDTVQERQTAAQVLELLNWAAVQDENKVPT